MPSQVEKYLRRAKEAEEWASAAADTLQKQHWRDIACGYRNLAQARQSFLTESVAPLSVSQALLRQ